MRPLWRLFWSYQMQVFCFLTLHSTISSGSSRLGMPSSSSASWKANRLFSRTFSGLDEHFTSLVQISFPGSLQGLEVEEVGSEVVDNCAEGKPIPPAAEQRNLIAKREKKYSTLTYWWCWRGESRPGWPVDTKWAELPVLSLRLLSTQSPSNGKKYPFDIDQQYCKDMKCAEKLILSVSELVWRFPTWAGGASCRPFRSISSLELYYFLQSHLCFDLIQPQELYPGKNTFKRIFHSTSIVLLVTNNS